VEGELTPEDKELFQKGWKIEDGELSEEEILMAIKLGQF
jgi:hypothetical protein